MTQHLSQLSGSITTLVANAAPGLTAIRIGQNRHEAITGQLQHPVMGRTRVAEVARIDDDLHPPIAGRNLLQNGDRTIARAIIDEQMLVVVAREPSLHYLAHPVIALGYSGLLVVAGGENADLLSPLFAEISNRRRRVERQSDSVT